MTDIVERARLIQRVNAHWSDSICECEECTEERFGLITPMADEIESLRSRLAEVEAERDKILRLWLDDADPAECGYAADSASVCPHGSDGGCWECATTPSDQPTERVIKWRMLSEV